MLGLSKAVCLAASFLLASSSAYAQQLELTDGKLQSISSAGIAESTLDFPAGGDSSRTLRLGSSSTLKLSFGTKAPSGGDGGSIAYSSLILSTASPRGLAVALAAPTNSSDPSLFRRANNQVSSVSIALTPRKGGKYRWEWDLATTIREDVLSLARKGDGTIRAALMVVPSSPSVPAQLLPLGFIHFSDEGYWKTEKPAKWPREWEMDRYSPREELHWTFTSPRARVGTVKALVGLALVLAPWTILAALLPYILPSLSFASDTSAVPFFASLLAFEVLIVSYWLAIINAWQLMPLTAVSAIFAFFTGKAALGQKMARRIQVESDKRVGIESKKSS